MNVQLLTKQYKDAFIAYCRKNMKVHDESFLSKQEMQGSDFVNTKINPTIILLENNRICGVLSVMLEFSFSEELKKHRIRIFHTEEACIESYRLLWNKFLELKCGSNELFLFIPKKEKTNHMPDILKILNFRTERISYVLMRRDQKYQKPEFPPGFSIRPVDVDSELEKYADLRNKCFKNLLGTRKRSAEDFLEFVQNPHFLKNGMVFLEYQNAATGFLTVSFDEDDEDYEAGYTDIWLSVNGENSNAVSLYVSEGFEVEDEIMCFCVNLNKK